VAIKKVGVESDLVIVVGSANSSNTVRLVEVALEAGAKAAYRVDFASEIDEAWFEGVETVGVTSGASVPEELVDEVLAYLANREFSDVRTVQTVEEDVQFSLPAELRKELKAAGQDVSNKAKR
jgi:4-hydroxy-3-methylbut-2-enyl diphosphate reductase